MQHWRRHTVKGVCAASARHAPSRTTSPCLPPVSFAQRPSLHELPRRCSCTCSPTALQAFGADLRWGRVGSRATAAALPRPRARSHACACTLITTQGRAEAEHDPTSGTAAAAVPCAAASRTMNQPRQFPVEGFPGYLPTCSGYDETECVAVLQGALHVAVAAPGAEPPLPSTHLCCSFWNKFESRGLAFNLSNAGQYAYDVRATGRVGCRCYRRRCRRCRSPPSYPSYALTHACRSKWCRR